jgi:hypothetical protein
MSRVDMALVCKVLLDTRFLELKRENEQLKRGCQVWRRWPMKSEDVSEVGFEAKWKGVELLALASKALMDTRLLDVKRENERMKLELFWQNYSAPKLSKALCKFHNTMNLFYCGCVSCKSNGRMIEDIDVAEWTAMEVLYAGRRWKSCAYKPWLEEFLGDLDLRVAYGVDYGLDFEHFRFFGTEHWFWGYGPRFTKARSVGDPELRRLEGVFDTLYIMSHPS